MYVPSLELAACPLKPVVWVSEATESREEDIEVCVWGSHDYHLRLQHSKYGSRHSLQHRRVQVLYAMMQCHIRMGIYMSMTEQLTSEWVYI